MTGGQRWRPSSVGALRKEKCDKSGKGQSPPTHTALGLRRDRLLHTSVRGASLRSPGSRASMGPQRCPRAAPPLFPTVAISRTSRPLPSLTAPAGAARGVDDVDAEAGLPAPRSSPVRDEVGSAALRSGRPQIEGGGVSAEEAGRGGGAGLAAAALSALRVSRATLLLPTARQVCSSAARGRSGRRDRLRRGGLGRYLSGGTGPPGPDAWTGRVEREAVVGAVPGSPWGKRVRVPPAGCEDRV